MLENNLLIFYLIVGLMFVGVAIIIAADTLSRRPIKNKAKKSRRQ